MVSMLAPRLQEQLLHITAINTTNKPDEQSMTLSVRASGRAPNDVIREKVERAAAAVVQPCKS
jgi:hypothetical protein